jgi:hypothetical protein
VLFFWRDKLFGLIALILGPFCDCFIKGVSCSLAFKFMWHHSCKVVLLLYCMIFLMWFFYDELMIVWFLLFNRNDFCDCEKLSFLLRIFYWIIFILFHLKGVIFYFFDNSSCKLFLWVECFWMILWSLVLRKLISTMIPWSNIIYRKPFLPNFELEIVTWKDYGNIDCASCLLRCSHLIM